MQHHAASHSSHAVPCVSTFIKCESTCFHLISLYSCEELYNTDQQWKSAWSTQTAVQLKDTLTLYPRSYERNLVCCYMLRKRKSCTGEHLRIKERTAVDFRVMISGSHLFLSAVIHTSPLSSSTEQPLVWWRDTHTHTHTPYTLEPNQYTGGPVLLCN